MKNIQPEWYNLSDWKKNDFNRRTWIPLKHCATLVDEGRYGYIGYRNEFISISSAMLPLETKDKALKTQWSSFNVHSNNKYWIEDNKYYTSGTYKDYDSKTIGNYLVLVQTFDSGEPQEWHLDQDLALALNLLREGDDWVRPEDDYEIVVRLIRDENNEPIKVEIKNKYLKDYLCARKSGLLIGYYHSREAIIETELESPWKDESNVEEVGAYRWEGRLLPIHEGGESYGSKTAVFHIGREDVDYDEDVPRYGVGPAGKFKSEKKIIESKGRKLFRIIGEIWKNEWVTPGVHSAIVRGDQTFTDIPFIIEADGTQASGAELRTESRWLWFDPAIVNELLKHRGGGLNWYTRFTGQIGASNMDMVHYGVNDIGLINVYAKDISYLPYTHQKIWASFNCLPDGGVCKELQLSQMEAVVAETIAPEMMLTKVVGDLHSIFLHEYGIILFDYKEGEYVGFDNIHRFLVVDEKSFFILAKEITKSIIERISKSELTKITLNAPKKIGSLKRLEYFFNEIGVNGSKLLGPFFAIYDLRIHDAHVINKAVNDQLKILRIEDSDKFVIKGQKMIEAFVGTAVSMIKLLVQHVDT